MTPATFKSIRIKAGLNQTALAKQLGCTRMQVWRYENGKQSISFLVERFMLELAGKHLMQ